jgi:TFIIF-interacting CTD phosphatase-like protein
MWPYFFPLEKMSTMFEVITFTASQECYAEALLKIIDPEKKYIRHRYYRDSCVPVFGNYVKVKTEENQMICIFWFTLQVQPS